jgi:hypothetical protein
MAASTPAAPVATVPPAASPSHGSGRRAAAFVVVGLLLLAIGGGLLWSRLQVNAIVGSVQPTPTPFVAVTTAPAVAGPIAFGTGYNADTLAVTGERSTFARTYSPIAWSATFSEPAGATTLSWIIASQSASGTEAIVWTQEVTISNPAFDTLANKDDLALIVSRVKGRYVMRYLRGATVLAEGTFTLQ